MKIVAQRVSSANVKVENQIIGQIGTGLVLLIGIKAGDDDQELNFWADKCVNLRVFRDNEGRMNRSLKDVDGSILAISQFTLYADVRRGRRPSYVGAAPPEEAQPLYDKFVGLLRERGVGVETGKFGAMMQVEIHNDGPVTIVLER